MLQSIREKTSGWIASIILGLIILTMAFFGIESYMTGKVETYVAKIEGPAKYLGYFGKPVHEIDPNAFRERFDKVRQQQRQEQGKNFDAAAFETVQNKREVLDQMVDESLLTMVGEQEGLLLSKSAVQKEIMKQEAFQVGGHFDSKQYLLVLKSQNMTPQQLEKLIATDLTTRLIPEQLLASQFTSDSELDAYLRTSRQTRAVRVLDIPAPAPTTIVPPTAAEIQAWYASHASQYRSPEQVAVEYVELNAAAMPIDAVADEATLRERYDKVKSKYGAVEQRMASHILVKLDPKPTPVQEASALAKARDLAAKARLPGANFAALARDNSDDIGSKDAGGDLGPVEKGVFGAEFDKAFYALQPGQVSDPIRLPDGWHVLFYRELIPGSAKSFEEVRPELEAEYNETERERVFNDISGKLIDKIYADPSSLSPAAQELKLPLNRTALFSRNQGEGIAALEPVRKAAFNDAQKTERQVSDPVEVEPNHIILLHVTDFRPAAPLPLASIQARVSTDILTDRIAKATKASAEAMLARALKGESLDALGLELAKPVTDLPKISRQAPSPELSPLVDEAFSLPRPIGSKATVGLARMAADRYALVSVTAVTDGDPKTVDADTRAKMKDQLAKMHGAVDARSFVQALRKQYKITIAEDRL